MLFVLDLNFWFKSHLVSTAGNFIWTLLPAHEGIFFVVKIILSVRLIILSHKDISQLMPGLAGIYL